MQVTVEGNNTMLSRTVRAIAVKSTRNIQDGARLFTLDTGRFISTRKWTVLSITKDVVDPVHQLARGTKATTRTSLVNNGVLNGNHKEELFEPVYANAEKARSDEPSEDGSSINYDSTYYTGSEGGYGEIDGDNDESQKY